MRPALSFSAIPASIIILYSEEIPASFPVISPGILSDAPAILPSIPYPVTFNSGKQIILTPVSLADLTHFSMDSILRADSYDSEWEITAAIRISFISQNEP